MQSQSVQVITGIQDLFCHLSIHHNYMISHLFTELQWCLLRDMQPVAFTPYAAFFLDVQLSSMFYYYTVTSRQISL